jgi:predicted metalloprotease
MRVGGPMVLGGGGLLLLLAVSLFTGIDPSLLLNIAEQTNMTNVSVDQGEGRVGVPQDEVGQFTSTVLASTEDVWAAIFQQSGKTYSPPRMVLFTDAVQSGCGTASSAVGPFYCPVDQKLYIDVSFFDELERRFGASGDFAHAYVIAHEIGHHVQTLIGTSEKVQRARQQAGSTEESNELSVRMELQADCYAGVWGYHANQQQRLLEPGDVDEGLAAAAAIGDDRIQRQAGATVQAESWTHGSSAMRARWLRRGLESGDVGDCETFGADRL